MGSMHAKERGRSLLRIDDEFKEQRKLKAKGRTEKKKRIHAKWRRGKQL